MSAIAGRYVGARVKRVEDKRLLAGAGRYVDDVHRARACCTPPSSAAPTRTPRSASIDARRPPGPCPGVHLILTGADLESRTYPLLRAARRCPASTSPTFWALAVDRVRHVGDPVAIVVADSRRLAEDACELIEVDYQPLPAVATVEQALDTEPGRDLAEEEGQRPLPGQRDVRATSTPPSPPPTG